MKQSAFRKATLTQQRGLTFFGLIFWIALLGSLFLLGMKCTPVVSEYFAVKKAVSLAKTAGDAAAIRSAFDMQTRASYIDTVTSKDLTVETVSGITTVGFAYQRVVPIAGPVSLLFDFTGTELVR
jgi:Domain of unknown function (DUF4845)